MVICSPNTLYAYLQADDDGRERNPDRGKCAKRSRSRSSICGRISARHACSSIARASSFGFAAQNVDSARQALRELEMRLERCDERTPLRASWTERI